MTKPKAKDPAPKIEGESRATVEDDGDGMRLHGSRGDAVTMTREHAREVLAAHDKGHVEGMIAMPDGGSAMWCRDTLQVLYPQDYMIVEPEMVAQLRARPERKP